MSPTAPYRRNKLYRSNDDRILFGVCGGIAEHFDFPPIAVRLLWALLTIFTFFWAGMIIYIILGIFMRPAPPRAYLNTENEEFWNLYQSSRPAALRKLQRRYQMIDKRLQRIESIVTSPGFKLENEYRKL